MLIVKRLLKSSLKHLLGKYLKDKQQLEDLDIINGQLELNKLEIDTNALYEASEKLMGDAFQKIRVKRMCIDHTVVSFSKDILSEIYIDGVHVEITTTEPRDDVSTTLSSASASAFVNSADDRNERNTKSKYTDSIFPLDDESDTSEDSITSDEEDIYDVKRSQGIAYSDINIFSKAKRGVTLLTGLIKQIGNVNVVITNINIAIDDFTVESPFNKLVIRYNQKHANQTFPFDYVLSVTGITVKYKSKTIVSNFGFECNLENRSMTFKALHDTRIDLSTTVLKVIYRLIQHVQTPIKRLKHIRKQFKKEFNQTQVSVSSVHLEVSKIRAAIKLYRDGETVHVNAPDNGIRHESKYYVTCELNGYVGDILVTQPQPQPHSQSQSEQSKSITFTSKIDKFQIRCKGIDTNKVLYNMCVRQLQIGLSRSDPACDDNVENTNVKITKGIQDLMRDVEYTYTESNREQTIALSPFEKDKVRLFNKVVKPYPVGNKQHRKMYNNRVEEMSVYVVKMSLSNGIIEMCDLRLLQPSVDGLMMCVNDICEVRSTMGENMYAVDDNDNSNNDNIKTCYDISVNNFVVKELANRYEGVISGVNLHCSLGTGTYNYTSLDIAHALLTKVDETDNNRLKNILMLYTLALATDTPAKHLSVDANQVVLYDIAEFIKVYRMLPQPPKSDERMEIFIRVYKPCIYYDDFYLKLSKLEMFNAIDRSTGTDIDQFNVASNKLILYRKIKNEEKMYEHSKRIDNIEDDYEYQFLLQLQHPQYVYSVNHVLTVNDADLLYLKDTHVYVLKFVDCIKSIIATIKGDEDSTIETETETKTKAEAEANIETVEVKDTELFNVITSYGSEMQVTTNNVVKPWLEVNVLKFQATMVDANNPRDQVLVILNKFAYSIGNNQMDFSCGLLEIIDRLSTSVWNKAVIMKDIGCCYMYPAKSKMLSFATNGIVHLNIDQDIGLFLSEFFVSNDNNINEQGTSADEEDSEVEQDVEPFCVHLSKFDLILNYKHKHTPAGSYFYLLTLLNFIPIRNSEIHIGSFDGYNLKTMKQFITEYFKHLLIYIKKDLGGLIKGIKPIQPLTKIVEGGCKLILIPVGAVKGQSLQRLAQQAKDVTRETTISILEVGGSLQTEDYYHTHPHAHTHPYSQTHPHSTTSQIQNKSVFSNQPQCLKDGVVQGANSFTEGMTTIVTFITDDNADLFQLPAILIKPFAGFLANTFLGACNQIDPERYQRIKDKYK